MNNVVPPVAAHIPGAVVDPDVKGALMLQEAKPPIFFRSRVSNRQKKHLVESIPELQFVFTGSDIHPHPVAAMERYWAEYKALCCMQATLRWNTPGQLNTHAQKVIAFNSSTARIAGHNMLDVVEFYQGVETAADVFRNIEAVPGATVHNGEIWDVLADNGMFGGILWTHCLHKFTPDEIAAQLVMTEHRYGMALMHSFDGYQGTCCAEEAVWTRCGANMDEVEMAVTGGTPYRHSACDWLYANGRHIDFDGTEWTLCWTTRAKVGDTTLLEFRLHEGRVAFVTPETNMATIAGALRTAYGEVDLRTYHRSGPAKNRGTDVILVPTTKYYAFGPFDDPKNRKLIIVPDGKKPLVVPNGLISELAGYVGGKKRNVDSWQSVLSRAKQLLKETTLSSTQAAAALPYVAALGFLEHLEDETNALQMVGGKEALIAEHSKLTDFDFTSKWYNRIIARVPGIAPIIKWFASMLPKIQSWTALLVAFAVWRLPWFRRLLFGSFRKGSWLEAVRTFKRLIIRIYNQFTVYFTSRYRPIKVGDEAGKAICVGKRELRATHEDARIYYDETLLNDECKTGFGNMPIGVFVIEPRPTVFGNCIHNDLCAVNNRGCIARPDDEVTQPFWTAATKWEMQYPTLATTKVHPIPTEQWLSRFPAPRQAEHRRALLVDTYREVDTASEAFTKRENAINWTSATGVVLSDPRLIQGKSSLMQIILGPYFVAYSKFAARAWSGDVRSDVPQTYFYASGTNANAIGRWFDRSIRIANDLASERKEHVVMIDLDQSRFDATVGIPALEYNLAMYKRNGMPQRSQDLYKRGMSCKGATSHSVRFSVVGTRKSGEADTSVGNSALNKCVGSVYAALCTSWTSMALLGDDNNTISVSPFPPQVAAVGLVDVCIDAGFTPEAHVVTSKFDMTFCSSRFWPSTAGTILGPKIGRVIAKTFFATRMVDEAEAMGQVRGICLGMVNDVSHVPVLRALIPRMIELTSGHKAIAPRQYEQRFHATINGACNDETWEMILHLYDLTRDDILELEDFMRGVPSLPCCLNHWALDRIIEVDCPMKGSEKPAKSELVVDRQARLVTADDYQRLEHIDPIGSAARSLLPMASIWAAFRSLLRSASVANLAEQFAEYVNKFEDRAARRDIEALEMVKKAVKTLEPVLAFSRSNGVARHFRTFSWHDVVAAPLYEEWGKRHVPHVWWLLPLLELLGDLPNFASRLIMIGFHTWCAKQGYWHAVIAHAANNYAAGVLQSAVAELMARPTQPAALVVYGVVGFAWALRVIITGKLIYLEETKTYLRNFANRWVA